MPVKFLLLHCPYYLALSLEQLICPSVIDDLTFSFVGAVEVYKDLLETYLFFCYICLKLAETQLPNPVCIELLSCRMQDIAAFFRYC